MAPFAEGTAETPSEYQSLIETVSACSGHETVDGVVRNAVLDACEPRGSHHRNLLERARSSSGERQRLACVALQQEASIWSLSPAAETLGWLLGHLREAMTPEEWRSSRPGFITTNFDGLIEIAIERSGLRPRTIEVVDDQRIQPPHLGDDEVEVWHLHGFWCGTTMHTRDQLRTHRSSLEESLRHMLRNSVVSVLGYGGWQDALTRALAKAVSSYQESPTVLWSFFEGDSGKLESQNTWLLEQLKHGKVNNRVHYFVGVDAHDALPSVREGLRSKHSARCHIEVREKVIPQLAERLIAEWSPESGGVLAIVGKPDSSQSWTTAQALCALLTHPNTLLEVETRGGSLPDRQGSIDVDRAFGYLCEAGWGLMEGTSQVTEIGAWTILALVHYTRFLSRSGVDDIRNTTACAVINERLATLLERQSSNGGFVPFGSVRDSNSRTYSSAMAVWAATEVVRDQLAGKELGTKLLDSASHAAQWLVSVRKGPDGWYPNPNRPYRPQDRFPGLSAQVLLALMSFSDLEESELTLDGKLAAEFLEDRVLQEQSIHTNASLQNRDQHVEGSQDILEGSSFLWFPWSLAVTSKIAGKAEHPEKMRQRALWIQDDLIARVLEEYNEDVGDGGTFELAEYLLGFAIHLESNDLKS